MMSKDAVWDYFRKIDSAAVGNAKNAAGSAGLLLLLDLFLISVALQHYPCLFNRTKSCVWYLPVYLSVSAEDVVELSASVSVSAESQFMTFGRGSVSAETRNSVSVGLSLSLLLFSPFFLLLTLLPFFFPKASASFLSFLSNASRSLSRNSFLSSAAITSFFSNASNCM